MRNILLFGKLGLLSIFFLIQAEGFAQFSQEWVARYNGPLNSTDVAQSIAVDASGNVYVTGSTGFFTESDYATIKYYPAGVMLWEARYNGPRNALDEAWALTLDADGNVYVTGASTGLSSLDYATIKYNSAGVLQWVARF